MRLFIKTMIVAVTVGLSLPAAAECLRPAEPDLPDGAVAAKADMMAAVKAVKKFQADLVVFRDCLNVEEASSGDEISEEIHRIAVQRHNASVEAEEAFIAQFNKEIRAYKAAKAAKAK